MLSYAAQEALARKSDEGEDMSSRAHIQRAFVWIAGCIMVIMFASSSSGAPTVTELKGYDEAYGLRLPTTYLAADVPELVDFTPDGKSVVVAPSGWHKALMNPMVGGNRHVDDHRIYVWSLKSGQIDRKFKLHKSRVSNIKVAPDGRTVLSSSQDGVLLYWDLSTGKVLHRLKGYKGERKPFIGFSASSAVAVTVSYQQALRVWDLISGRVLYTSTGKRAWGDPAAMSPDGKYVAWVSEGGVISVVSVASGRVKRVIETRNRSNHSSIRCIAFSPDGALLAVGEGREARVYDVATAEVVAELPHPYTANYFDVAGVVFSKDGKHLLTFGNHTQIMLWDIAAQDIVKELKVAGPSVLDAAMAPSGSQLLAMQGNSWEVYRWPLEKSPTSTRQAIRVLARLSLPKITPSSLTFSPDGYLLAAATGLPGTSSGKIVFWNTKTWKRRRELAAATVCSTLVFSPDSKELVTACQNRTYIRDLVTGGYIPVAKHPDLSSTGYVNYKTREKTTCASLYDPQGIHYVSAHAPAVFGRNRDENRRMWDLKSMKPLGEYTLNKFSSVVLTPDRKHFLTGGTNHSIVVCETLSGRTLRSIAPKNGVKAITPDSSRFLSCRDHGYNADLFSIVDGTQISSFRMQSACINGPCVMLDNRRGLVTHDDVQIRLWDLEKGKELQSFFAHKSRIVGLAVSPDHRIAASVDFGGTILVWEIPIER